MSKENSLDILLSLLQMYYHPNLIFPSFWSYWKMFVSFLPTPYCLPCICFLLCLCWLLSTSFLTCSDFSEKKRSDVWVCLYIIHIIQTKVSWNSTYPYYMWYILISSILQYFIFSICWPKPTQLTSHSVDLPEKKTCICTKGNMYKNTHCRSPYRSKNWE